MRPPSSTTSSPSLQLAPPPPRRPAASSSAQTSASVAAAEDNDSSDIEIIAVKKLSNKRRQPSSSSNIVVNNSIEDDIVEIDSRTGRPIVLPDPPVASYQTRNRQSRRRIQDTNEESIRVIATVNTSGNATRNQSRLQNESSRIGRDAIADFIISSMMPRIQSRTVTVPQVIPATQLFPNSNNTSSTNASIAHPSAAKNNIAVLKALEKAKAMLPPAEEAAPAQLKCSICLELSSVTSKISSTNCGHLFCDECLNNLFSMPGATKCPNCRKGITKKGLRRVFLS